MIAISSRTVPAVISAGVVLALGAILVDGRELGALSLHMSLHIAAMNVAAPLLGAVLVSRYAFSAITPACLWIAALVQIAGLWVAHLPAVHGATTASHALQTAVHGILLLGSLAFWIAALAIAGVRRWHSVAALLMSGKLFCFLAVLLVRGKPNRCHHGMRAWLQSGCIFENERDFVPLLWSGRDCSKRAMLATAQTRVSSCSLMHSNAL